MKTKIPTMLRAKQNNVMHGINHQQFSMKIFTVEYVLQNSTHGKCAIEGSYRIRLTLPIFVYVLPFISDAYTFHT
jgi:hypothetical protein